jgi:inhibitor of cysteine peptidase
MTLDLGPADAGTHRSARVGDRAEVRLPENPTTGYRWQIASDDSRLRLVDDRFEGAQAPRGAGGVRVLVFEAVQAGSASLRLTKSRSWESGKPIEEFAVDLDVQPPE